jgi:hypothetical protein
MIVKSIACSTARTSNAYCGTAFCLSTPTTGFDDTYKAWTVRIILLTSAEEYVFLVEVEVLKKALLSLHFYCSQSRKDRLSFL